MKPHGLIYLVAIAVVVFIVSGLTVSFFHSVDPGPSGDSSSRPSLRGDGSALEANGDIFLSAAPPLPRTYPDKVSLPVSVSPSAPHDASSSNDEAPASGRGAAGPPDRDRDAERAGGEDEAPIVLLSVGKPASADVRGNLGPPQVVTDERVDDWLSDRWQGNVNDVQKHAFDSIIADHLIIQCMSFVSKLLSTWAGGRSPVRTGWRWTCGPSTASRGRSSTGRTGTATNTSSRYTHMLGGISIN